MTKRGSIQETFSGTTLRRNLGYFAAGKVGSGLVGIAIVILLVRQLGERDYGAYVALAALLEIALLISNVGAYPIAQRYFAEAKLPVNRRWLVDLVIRSLNLRVGSLVAISLLIATASSWIAESLRLPVLATALPLYALVIVCEGVARYIDLIFEGMLEQGRNQLCVLVRNGVRLAAFGACVQVAGTLTLRDAVAVDLTGAVVGLSFSGLVLRASLRARTALLSASRETTPFSWRRMMAFALPLYIAQFLTQLYGPDTVKLLVGRTLGAVEVAAFGFAHAMSMMLQRYLPAQLLLGLIRPVLVARQADGADSRQLVEVGNLVLKINHFLLVPIAAFLAVAGTELVVAVAKGKYASAGPILFWLTSLLLLQGLHVVLSMLATAMEDRRAVLIGTISAVPGILAGIGLMPGFGVDGMVVGLWVSEILWCVTTHWTLSTRGFHFSIDWQAWLKLVAAGALAGGIALVPALRTGGFSQLLMQLTVVALVFLTSCRLLQPFSAEERSMINRMLPRPLFVF